MQNNSPKPLQVAEKADWLHTLEVQVQVKKSTQSEPARIAHDSEEV